jgi:hypothetical protein
MIFLFMGADNKGENGQPSMGGMHFVDAASTSRRNRSRLFDPEHLARTIWQGDGAAIA